MVKALKFIIPAVLIIIIAFCFGYKKGRDNTWYDFASEKCWIHKPSMDVVCIQKVN